MRTARFATAATLTGVLALSACSDPYEDPYREAQPPPPAADVLEYINLAAVGLRSYECDLFEAPQSRCYDAARWGSIRAGRETLAHVHRELLAAGAWYFGGSEHTRADEAPEVSGLNLGCYFDYAAQDYALRVAVVGPSGEGLSCKNGLPADGVSEVWVIAAEFDAEEIYERVEIPLGFELLLRSLPHRPTRSNEVYGGQSATATGYEGPELPALGDGAGVHVLPETLSVRDGVVRGLVQYRGAAPTLSVLNEDDGPEATAGPGQIVTVQRETSGAWGIVIGVANESTTIPIVVRPGESAPFELPLPEGFTAEDVHVLTGWQHVEEDWRGALWLAGPEVNSDCGAGQQIGGEPVEALIPATGQECLEVFSQATTTVGDRIIVDGLVAIFNEDGTIYDVLEPYVIREDGGQPGLIRLNTNSPDLRFAWVSPAGFADSVGIWMRYAKLRELANSPAV